MESAVLSARLGFRFYLNPRSILPENPADDPDQVFVSAKDDAADGLATMFNGEGEQDE